MDVLRNKLLGEQTNLSQIEVKAGMEPALGILLQLSARKVG
jgi:hypothetical protein